MIFPWGRNCYYGGDLSSELVINDPALQKRGVSVSGGGKGLSTPEEGRWAHF